MSAIQYNNMTVMGGHRFGVIASLIYVNEYNESSYWTQDIIKERKAQQQHYEFGETMCDNMERLIKKYLQCFGSPPPVGFIFELNFKYYKVQNVVMENEYIMVQLKPFLLRTS